MTFEKTTIEEPPVLERPIGSEESIMGQSDIERIDEIIYNIGEEERPWTLEEYNKEQIEEAERDPNKHLTALKLGKKDDKLTDIEMMNHFIDEKDKHGFSLSSRFALENTQHRKDLSDEYLKKDYLRLKSKISEVLEDINKKEQAEA